MVSKKVIVPVAAVAISVATLFGVSKVYAQNSSSNPTSGLVQAIAQKFGLDQNQVQNVVDQYKTQHKSNMQQNMQERLKQRLDQAVKDGIINSTQEQALLDELSKLRSKYSIDSLKSMTPAQRQQAMKDQKTELENFAKSQNIDLSKLKLGFGGRGMWKRGWVKPSVTPTP